MKDEHFSAVDGLIVGALKASKAPLSTYQIGKKLKISWSTANTHCYKLQAMGHLNMDMITNHIGQTKMLWRLK